MDFSKVSAGSDKVKSVMWLTISLACILASVLGAHFYHMSSYLVTVLVFVAIGSLLIGFQKAVSMDIKHDQIAMIILSIALIGNLLFFLFIFNS